MAVRCQLNPKLEDLFLLVHLICSITNSSKKQVSAQHQTTVNHKTWADKQVSPGIKTRFLRFSVQEWTPQEREECEQSLKRAAVWADVLNRAPWRSLCRARWPSRGRRAWTAGWGSSEAACRWPTHLPGTLRCCENVNRCLFEVDGSGGEMHRGHAGRLWLLLQDPAVSRWIQVCSSDAPDFHC